MKKTLIFGGGVLAFAVAGMGLRYWQHTAAFEGATGLLLPRHPATLGLMVLMAAACVALWLLGRWVTRGWTCRSYLAAFSLPCRGLLAGYLVAGGLLVAAGLLGLGDYRADPTGHWSLFALSLALIPAGLDMALVGWLNAQREEARGRFAWPLLLPGVCGCFWMIAAYQQYNAEPSAMVYAPYFLAVICAVGGCYAMAAFSFEAIRPVRCLWLCGTGMALLAACLVDAPTKRQLFTGLGYLIYLACQTTALLWRVRAPADLEPWTPAVQAPEIPEETEVDDHE